MFVKTKIRRNKTYISFVESYRDQGKVKQRTIFSLGCIENFKQGQLSSLADKLKRLDIQNDILPNTARIIDELYVNELEILNWGGPKIVRHLWNLFDLDSMLDSCLATSKIQFNVKETIFRIVLNRFLSPASKLKIFEQQSKYVGCKNIELQHFYRSLDFLCEHKDSIEKSIFLKNKSLFNMKIDVVFYDVTTLYFESNRPNELKDFGYSKDCKFNEVQIVLGLLVDSEGRPVGYDVYPGNTFEGNTLEMALHKLKARFQVGNVIIVADRGINSKLNLKGIRDAQYDYIVGCRLRKMPRDIRELATDIDSYTTIFESDDSNDPSKKNIIKTKTIDYENSIKIAKSEKKLEPNREVKLKEKIILTWSSKRAEKDKRDRERLVSKAIKIVNNPSMIKDCRGAKKYIKQNTPNQLSLRTEKIVEDAKWDGFYGIQTSNLKMSDGEVVSAYKNLWRIEESFRILKFSLQTRPIFHWNANRIKGHIMVCFLTLLLERTLEAILRQHKISFSVDKIQSSLSDLTLTPLKLQDHDLYLRSKVEGLGQDIFRVLNIKIPRILTPKSEFEASI